MPGTTDARYEIPDKEKSVGGGSVRKAGGRGCCLSISLKHTLDFGPAGNSYIHLTLT